MCATVPPSSVVQAKLEAFGRVNIVRNNDGASGADNIFAGLVLCDRYQFDRRGAWRDVVGRLGRCAQARVATLSAHHVQRSTGRAHAATNRHFDLPPRLPVHLATVNE
jgi:hypothetical protein